MVLSLSNSFLTFLSNFTRNFLSHLELKNQTGNSSCHIKSNFLIFIVFLQEFKVRSYTTNISDFEGKVFITEVLVVLLAYFPFGF